jgi:CRP/FNR family cyclic AMP-dependent transcriptional regulator
MKTFPWKKFLQIHPIFSTIRDEKTIDALLDDEVSWERTYAKDDVIVRQREAGDSVFVIGAGVAEAVLELSEGPSISLSVMWKGELFGEVAFLEHKVRSATVRAKEPCTVLEIRGPEFLRLMVDHPDIQFRLLEKMSERLRNTGEQILGLNLTNVDEKLRLFNLKLDTEQRLFESSLKAAQTMFDQTKLRADEVINSAERSRDRLQKTIGLVSAFATLVIMILAAFGFKQVWDVSRTAEEVRTIRDKANIDAKQSVTDFAKIQEAGKASSDALLVVNNIKIAFNDLKSPFTDIVRGRFMDAVFDGKMADAKRDYASLKSLGGIEELGTAVSWLELTLLTEKPQRDDVIVGFLEDLTRDARQGADKSLVVKVYYLRIGYSILTDQNRSARNPLYAELREYLKNNPTAMLEKSIIPSAVLEKVQRQNADKAAELRDLGILTTRL